MAEIVLYRMPPALKGHPSTFNVMLTHSRSLGTPYVSAREAMAQYNSLVEQGHTLSQDDFLFQMFGDQNVALQFFKDTAAAEEAADQAGAE